MKIILKIAFAILIFNVCYSEKIIMFNNTDTIEFAKITEYTVNLSDFKNKIEKNILKNSYLTIQVNVGIDKNCLEVEKSCQFPLRIYSKLNQKPYPQSIDFEKKDDTGIIYKNETIKNIIYEIEYSPCEFFEDDILYIKLLGFEKKSNYDIKVSLLHDKLIRVLCNQKQILEANSSNQLSNITTNIDQTKNIKVINPPSLYHYSSVLTDLGTIRIGGIFNKTVDNNLFLLNSANNWEIINPKGNSIPKGRYGHNLFYFDNYLILFGGKDKNDNILGDLWVFDLNEKEWIEIYYTFKLDENKENSLINNADNKEKIINTKNQFGISKFMASGIIIKNIGKILIYGGQNDLDDKNIYMLNLEKLVDIVKSFKAKKFSNFFQFNEKKEQVANKLRDLWEEKKVEDLTPRYGLSITQLNNLDIMFFGGLDRNSNTLSTLEILNIQTFKVSIVEPKGTNEFPSGRAFHKIEKVGPILILTGGENSFTQIFGDIWKFTIENFKWIKIEMDKEIESLTRRSNFDFIKIFQNGIFYERLTLYGGYGKNREIRNDFITFDFDICTTPISISSKNLCLPCSEGYILNSNNKCEACSMGYYQDFEYNIYNKDLYKLNSNYIKYIDENNEIKNLNIEANKSLNFNELYFSSKCEPCPKKTFNNRYAMPSISSCRLCDHGFYNNLNGQGSCIKCAENEICLPGAEEPIVDPILYKQMNIKKVEERNFPDFLNENSKTQFVSKLIGFLVLFFIIFFLLIYISFSYYFRKKITMRFLIQTDFLPLTGGFKQKTNGGLITLIYIATIISFTLFFIIRFLYFNQEIEVISLTHSVGNLDKKDFSLKIEIDLIGYEYNCIHPDYIYQNDFHDCHPDIDINKIENNLYQQIQTGDNKNNVFCKLNKENKICKILIEFKNCENFKNENEIEIFLKNPKSFVQAYYWSLESYWSDDFLETNGFSKIYSTFLPKNEFESGYIFKGEIPSLIEVLFNPIFYDSNSENIHLKGYKANHKQYKRGSIRNSFNFFEPSNGVKLRFKFSYSNNVYQVNKNNQFDIIDFLAFLLGMLAGFSFIARISKYFLEKYNILNYSEEECVSFNSEEIISKEIPLENKNNQFIENSD